VKTLVEVHRDLVEVPLGTMNPPFADQVRDVRNVIAHAADPGAEGPDYPKVYFLIRCMRHLMQAALLRATIQDAPEERAAMGRLSWPPEPEASASAVAVTRASTDRTPSADVKSLPEVRSGDANSGSTSER